jgi:hypothetical protein
MFRTPLLSAIVLSGLASNVCTAQSKAVGGARVVVVGPSQIHAPAPEVIDLPMPPRDAFEPSFAPHPRPMLPVGKGTRPQPQSPESTLGFLGLTLAGTPCDLKGHVIGAVKPSGAVHHTVGEPSVALAGKTLDDADTAFCTGNQFAARSDDGGVTWTHVDPYTRFPNLDGGFCCDQRTLYVPSRDITVWQLMYLPSAQRGSIRIAVAVGRNGLRNDVWHSFVFNPQQFGFPVGYWFDYPDLTYSDHHLYFAINVVTPTPWTNVDTVVMKMPLDEIKIPGGSVNTVYWTRSATLGPGPNFRFAQGSTHTMYLATHIDNTTLRVIANPDASSTVTIRDQTVASWTSASYTSLLANGVNWTARAGAFLVGGYASDSQYGFLWTADAQTGRPNPYLRVAKFRTSDDTLIEEEDVWSSQLAFAHPAATTNAVGDIGCVFAAGGAALNPASILLIVDDCRSSFAGTLFGWTFSSTGPSQAGWGDYFSMQRHPVRTLTFLASGMSMQGGSSHSDQEPSFLHYGRTRDELPWANVIITSKGPSGVPIAVRPTDQLGKSGVLTPGYASFLPADPGGAIRVHRRLFPGYALTAPAVHNSGGSTWVFQHWQHRSTPTSAWQLQPSGQTTLTLTTKTPTDESAEAVYLQL